MSQPNMTEPDLSQNSQTGRWRVNEPNGVAGDAQKSVPTFVFAHGAGAGMDSDFMETVATGLSEQGIRVIRFEFPYMQIRRDQGGRRPPDRAPKLLAHFIAELGKLDEVTDLSDAVVIGGKSMGGRMASMVAASDDMPLNVKGVVALGYPFHPQGKPEKLRVEHLSDLKVPMLIQQGTRDKLGDETMVNGLGLPEQVQVEWRADGDHDLKPRKSSGFTHQQHLQSTIEHVAEFVRRCL